MCLKVKHKSRLVIDKLLFIIVRELLSFAKYVTRLLFLSASWRGICSAAGNEEKVALMEQAGVVAASSAVAQLYSSVKTGTTCVLVIIGNV